jgi:hypothetical protein
MVAVDLSAFMQHVIERVGRQPNLVDDNRYVWNYTNGEIRLVVGNTLADITVELFVDSYSLDMEDSYYHHYELTEFDSDNGTGIGPDGSSWTYNDLIEIVGCQVAATLNLG